MEKDQIDTLMAEWESVEPAMDTGAMAIVGRLIRAGDQLRDSATKALKPYGLLYTDFDILATLRRSPPPHRLSPTALSNAVLLTSGAMTAALKRLQDRGLITRVTEDGDGRAKTVQLTEKGVELASKAAKARFAEASSMVTSLNKSEQEQLADILRKLLLSWPA